MKTSIIAVALIAAASFSYAADSHAVSTYNTMQASEHATPATTLPASPSTAPKHEEMKKSTHRSTTAKHIEKKKAERKAATIDGSATH